MTSVLRSEIERLGRDERLELLDALWDLVRDDALPVPESHRVELARRLAEYESDPTPGIPWPAFRDRLRAGR